MPILQCQGLTKNFGSLCALDHVDLSIEPGRIIGLLGPNGSGKTTLIKLANGLLQPTSGSILIDGCIPSPQTHALVSYLPERIALVSWMNVRQLMDFYGDFYADFQREAAERMIAQLELPLNQSLKQMSKGTREKLQLILTMSRKAKLYLLDEPIGGEVIFVNRGRIALRSTVDEIREQQGMSVDAYFREVFKCWEN